MMNKILLLDPDSKIPNRALMVLSTHHKQLGDQVFLNKCDRPDIVYASSVFTKSKLKREQIKAVYPSVIFGGTGYDLNINLEPEIESLMPDYSLYDTPDEEMTYSIGFTSRGCIRRCSFCIVPEKEGYIKSVNDIKSFRNPKSNYVKLLDNNFFASPDWKDRIEEIKKYKLKVDFNQGLDIRLLDDEKAKALVDIKIPYVRFAFDHVSSEKTVLKGIEILRKAGFPIRRDKVGFFILVGYDSTNEEDLYRCNLLHSMDINTQIQLYEGSTKITRHLARWGNKPWLWKKCSFEDYLPAIRERSQLRMEF